MGSKFGKNNMLETGNRKLLVLGVENSGKTNLCRRLVDGSFLYDHIPTKNPKDFTIHYEKQEWTLVVPIFSLNPKDVGGSERERMHWRFHLLGAHAVIFMVDISDPSKFHDVKLEIDGLVSNKYIKSSVVFILLNKRDLVNQKFINENEILLKINVSNRTIQEYNIKTQVVSIKTGEGLETAFAKLYSAMNDHVNKTLS